MDTHTRTAPKAAAQADPRDAAAPGQEMPEPEARTPAPEATGPQVPEAAGPQVPEPDEEDAEPRELESALLTLALFGGLVVFGIGCMTVLW